jgi:ribosomal protein S18 acetylase RimI-like enzyme
VTVSIREANADDIEAVLALWAAAADPGRTILDEPAALRRLLASASGTLLVAEVDGHILGTVVVGWDGWRGNLYRLVVAGEQRRRGVARALVTEAERRLRAVGCPRITALVHLGLPEAPKFWAPAGYWHDEPTGRFVRNLS